MQQCYIILCLVCKNSVNLHVPLLHGYSTNYLIAIAKTNKKSEILHVI